MGIGGAYSNACRVAGLAIAATLGLTAGVQAQDAGGWDADFTLSSGLTVSDRDDTDLRTDLGFGITSTTRTQSIGLQLETGIRTDLENGLRSDIANPNATLSYGIESRQTAITTSLSYRQADADTLVADPNDPNSTGVLVLDDGTRENINANFGLEFGREAKFGGDVTLAYRDTNYTDTTNASLIDQTTTRTGVGLRFEIDPTITATLGFNRSEEDRATGRDVRRETISTGANVAVTPAVNANVSLGTSRVTVTQGGVETVENGLTYDLGLTADRPNGALTFGLGSNLSESGRRSSVTLGRSMETRGGEFSAQIGLSEGEADRIRPILSLDYNQDFARGSYSVSLNQRFETSSLGQETLNSRLRLNWQRDLNRTSRIGSNLTYQVSDVLGADADTERLELGVRYSQDLTETWAWTTRFSHTLTGEDGNPTTRENAVFLGLETSIGWRP